MKHKHAICPFFIHSHPPTHLRLALPDRRLFRRRHRLGRAHVRTRRLCVSAQHGLDLGAAHTVRRETRVRRLDSAHLNGSQRDGENMRRSETKMEEMKRRCEKMRVEDGGNDNDEQKEIYTMKRKATRVEASGDRGTHTRFME